MWWYIIKLGSDFIWYLLIRWTKKSHFLFFYQWSLYVNWPYIHSVCCNLKLVDFANHESVLYILVKFTFNYKKQEKLTQFFHYFNIIFISSLDRNFGHLWPKENKYMIQVYHKTCETINCKISLFWFFITCYTGTYSCTWYEYHAFPGITIIQTNFLSSL